jgi:Putative transposase/Transposase zinc-binding domain
MTASALELADIFRIYGPAYLDMYGASLSAAQRKALSDIAVCRTAALGGHVEQCDRCGHRTIAYCSCRNRHCPKCQSAARAAWLDRRAAELLPVEYFHVVFTLPQMVAPVALQNQRTVYGMLFRAAAETLLQIAADPKHLGASIGFVAVLHTWGQNLHHHPHLHCVVPGGGIAPDRSRWIACRRQFLLPVKVLSRLFRAKFANYLRRAYHRGELSFHGQLQPLGEKQNFFPWLNRIVQSEWVVYAKPPFGGPHQVLKYLARYTHRVAITNRRLIALQNDQVSFRWKDYRRSGQPAVMTLSATEFIRRFLLHVLPRGFVKIRHFGFLANRGREYNLRLCRALLCPASSNIAGAPEVTPQPAQAERCPLCREGCMQPVERLLPQVALRHRYRIALPMPAPRCNTS